MIAIETEMPKNCIDCEEKDIRLVNHCQLIFDGKADIERHPGCPLVEIVTCKECKYYRNKGDKYSYCTKRLNVDSITDRYREPNFYCADAERRE